MEKQITIREAVSQQDVSAFWEQLRAYHERDIFPDPADEDREYFLNDMEYRTHMQRLHDRPHDRCYYLFFDSDGQDIGFAMPVIYDTEDGKCFLMEFCVFPEFRGNGTGKRCAEVFLEWAKAHGAVYTELNYGGNDQRRRFWHSLGFLPNGVDEWGEPLMILPPEEKLPINVELVSDADDWQLMKLENGFLAEIGEGSLTDEKKEKLKSAVAEGSITFFVAKRGYRAVGMCSVATSFSTFSCTTVGAYDDFFVEPVFRGQGIARKLAKAAQDWCAQNGVSSLTVCCSPGDEAMYRALGFDLRLGVTYAHIPLCEE